MYNQTSWIRIMYLVLFICRNILTFRTLSNFMHVLKNFDVIFGVIFRTIDTAGVILSNISIFVISDIYIFTITYTKLFLYG